MSSVQATRIRKGHLVKHNNDLCRVVETQHVTPGNLRGFVRAKMRRVRDGALFEHRFRSEDMVERAILDEREMQYLYTDGADYYFMDTSNYEQISLTGEALGDNTGYLLPESTIRVEFYEGAPVGIELPRDRRSEGAGHGAGHQGRDGQRAGEAGDARNRPGRDGAGVHQQRRHDPREHGNRRISEPGVIPRVAIARA